MPDFGSSLTNEQYVDITQHEIVALRTRYNLADAHTHQQQSLSQRAIISRLPRLWYEAETGLQREFEQRFIESFFSLHGQHSVPPRQRSLLYYSASVATMVVGKYLLRKGMKVTLLEPCFDNLHDLLRNMNIDIYPLREESLHDSADIYNKLLRSVHTDALCLIDPNNPTGFSLLAHGRAGFEQVLRFCKEHKKILIMDFSFAAFAVMDHQAFRFDIYEMLDDFKVSYIAIEDTGKTWPTQDMKCAILTTSDDIAPEIYNIHTSVLLNVSPFILNVLCEYIENSRQDGFASVREILESNRQIAKQALAGTIIEYCKPVIKVSVGWFRIRAPNLLATELQRLLLQQEIYILPGTYFFWSARSRGEAYIRLALARETKLFAEALKRFQETLSSYGDKF